MHVADPIKMCKTCLHGCFNYLVRLLLIFTNANIVPLKLDCAERPLYNVAVQQLQGDDI